MQRSHSFEREDKKGRKIKMKEEEPMKKITALLLACLMMVSLLAGCGGGSTNTNDNANVAPEDRVLHMRTTSALLSTDWQASTLTDDMKILWVHVFEGLYGMDEANGGYFNLLAKDIAVSEDGLTYTVTLQDATFQNGDPLTAEDVVFSYKLAMENSRFNYVTSFISDITAQDEKTVVFTLDYPYSAIAHTFWTIKVVSQREYNEIVASGKEFGTEPHTAGTGPYILTEFDANFVKLKAYDGYWRGAPDIKNVEYRVITENAAAVIAFKNGELDYFTDVPLTDWESVKAASGENNAMLKANDIHWLGINYLSPTNNNILGNEKVREAIFWAINKDDCITAATAGYGSPAYEYMPSEYVATSPNYRDGKFATYDYAPDKAHQCLLDAGFTEEQIASGIDVGTILTYGDASLPKGKECVVIQANLAACGMKAEVETGDYSAVGPRMYSQDYDMAIFADSGNYDYNNIRQQVDSESVGMYVVRFKDDKSPFDWQKMEELVDAGVATADTKERYDIYTELWSMVMDTKTIYPILHTGVGVAWSQNINVPDVPPLYYHIEKMTWAN
jgi:peptide/nickel transport system substrate-binding protein